MPTENHTHEVSDDNQAVVAGTPVVVRRHAGVAALIGAAASAVAIAYLWRASQTMTGLDWALCGVMTVIAAVYLASLVDSRTPLLVADDLGVRVRLGHEWRGLPWDAIGQVVVHPRRGLLRDGRLVFAPHSLARALEGLEGKAKRHVTMNQKMYGAALAVPLGITTRISTNGERSVVDSIAALSLGRAEVIEVAPAPAAVEQTEAFEEAAEETKVDRAEAPSDRTQPADDLETSVDEPIEGPDLPDAQPAAVTTEHVEPAGSDPSPTPLRRSMLGGIGTIVSRVAKGRSLDVDGGGGSDVPAAPAAALAHPDGTPLAAPGLAVPLRETRGGARAEVTRDIPMTLGNTALSDPAQDERGFTALPESRELRRPGSVDLVFEPVDAARVRPISVPGEPVAPLVIDDFVTEPAYDPIIGPELAAARTRLGLSVDELADRTRIRPHVIESIEVDDFAPCGGDFYARGHLRTLARVLGKDIDPLLEKFEGRYATAPINARRVFEAELATGMTGSMRSTMGGPNWGLLAGVVISLVLVWGVVRLFAGEPGEIIQNPAPVLNGSAGLESVYPSVAGQGQVGDALSMTLVAAHADSQVVVRDGDGKVVFTGEMVLGEKKKINALPPVRVKAVDAGAIEVVVGKRDKGVLGVLGEPGRRTFR